MRRLALPAWAGLFVEDYQGVPGMGRGGRWGCVVQFGPEGLAMFGYFEKRPMVQWNLPSENRPGLGILDGVLPLAAQVEMQQRATGVSLDPVLRDYVREGAIS